MVHSAQTRRAKEIFAKISEDDLVECIVALPKQLLQHRHTGLYGSCEEKKAAIARSTFIDASEMGYMKDRVHRDLSDEDIANTTPITAQRSENVKASVSRPP